MSATPTNWKVDDPIREAQLRWRYATLCPGDPVEVVHHMKIGFREYESHTTGVVVSKGRRECGTEGGWRRNWDDRSWFDHLVLRKDDGELTTVTMDEYTEIKTMNGKCVKEEVPSVSIRPEEANIGGENLENWDITRFAGGAAGLGALIALAFGLPIALIAKLAGQLWVLWVCIPHVVLASVILGGVLSGVFLMDSPDGQPAKSPQRPTGKGSPSRTDVRRGHSYTRRAA